MPAQIIEQDESLHKLFVYGIFLDEGNRTRFSMSDPHYATVADHYTIGQHIVQAHKLPGMGLALTGLLVTLPDDYDWRSLDALEGGYDRVIITTSTGERAYMYAAPARKDTYASTD